MQIELLERQETELAALAEAWLAAGAKRFGIWVDGQPFASWPAYKTDATDAAGDKYPHSYHSKGRIGAKELFGEETILSAPFQVDHIDGELRVYGLISSAAKKRLSLDATWLTHLLQLENEMDTMTSEFIDIQDQLLAIYDLTKLARSRKGRSQTLSSLAHEASRLVKVRGACLWLEEPNRPILWAHHNAHSLTLQHIHYLNNTLADSSSYRQLTCVASGVTGGEDDDGGTEGNNNLPTDIQNLLLVPIEVRHGRAGLALLNHVASVDGGAEGSFTSPDIKLSLTIAEQAGAQIDLVLLHEETIAQTRLETEMQLAQSVQLNLLPRHPPNVPGLELWAGSRPALHVGGDFYDFVDEPGRPFIFTVGDVSGKGMPAALLMAMTRTVLRNGARFATPPLPDEFMRRANEDLYDDFTEVSMFVTVFVGRYDPGTRTIHYANAGHSPVIYCPKGGSAQLLEADGPAMGVLPVNLSENHTQRFNPGDVLIVATDGFSEAQNDAGEFFGYDALLRLVEKLAPGSATEIANGLFDTIDQFSAGHPQDDDQTLIVVKGVNIY